MTRSDRAAQLWPVLALAARNRQILTYDIVRRLISVPRPAVGGFLAPIQDYCMQRNLPALTIIFVSEDSGLAGVGFIAAQDVPAAHEQAFDRDWLADSAPSPDDLEQAYRRAHPNDAEA